MDKSWVHKDRWGKEYEDGARLFLDHAFEKGVVTEDSKMKCPCRKCNNVNYKVRSEIFSDLILHGMMRNYTTWFHHGESLSSTVSSSIAPQDTCFEVRNNNDERPGDDLSGMLRAVFGIPTRDGEGMDDRGDGEGMDDRGDGEGMDDLDEDEDMDNGDGGVSGLPSNCTASRFYKLLEESKIPLYPGCDKMSVMSFLVRFWNYKCVGGMSEKSAKDMLQLMRDSFPDDCNLPENFTQCKKILSELGLTYNKIDACPNDCILYYKEYANRETCPVCEASRYKSGTKTPAKILRHFPLRPRLQRLYMESKTAECMRWHAEGRPRDGKMRHPADSEAWKHFDKMNPTFAAEPRNIRLGLATDGFSPYHSTRNPHSTWPVVLLPYNLPPWLCMKQPNMILSLLIPGPYSPGQDIDVYLRPLIDELKELWEEGANTYDSSRNEMFNMRVGLLWTISDYPGLAMLSGWSTKGKLACLTCQEDTQHQRLKHGRKTCYMGHRRFLPMGHKFRSLTKEFNGNVEYGSPPNPLLGPDILQKLKHIPHVFGKQFEESLMGGRPRKRKERASNTATSNMPGNWKKLSIFYELSYWADNILKHNLDVMHTEKNVCDSIIGTLLDMDKKAKDGLKARLDLQLLNLRPELHPIMTANGKKFFLPNACYFMDNAKKEMFLSVLKNLKTPDGYSSLIARCVNMKQRKIFGLKSHDSHVIMQQLLPLAIRKTLPDRVSSVLIELSSFFQELCSKNSRPQDFKELEKRIALILCNLEQIFPPSFFDIMVHLLIHLPAEARIGGPVQYRWMYPIERYLYTLKKYVRNKAHPEGSIAEGYLADECVTFLSRHLKDVESRTNRPVRYVDDTHIGNAARFVLSGNQKKLLHDYILFNDANVDTYVEQHKATLAMLHPKMSQRQRQRKHKNEFADWFRNHIMLLGQAKLPFAEGLDLLADGPFTTARRFTGYTTRGYNFRTASKDSRAKTQNSGVVVESTAPFYRNAADQNPDNDTQLTYYGQVKDIIELTYRQGRKLVLFECDWFDVVRGSGRGKKVDSLGFTLVNFNYRIPTQQEEPFVLASQVRQVFYSQDPIDLDWHVVVRNKPRDVFDMGEGNADELLDTDPFGRDSEQVGIEDDDISVVRGEGSGVFVDVPARNVNSQHDLENGSVNDNIEEEDDEEEDVGEKEESEDEEYVDGVTDNDGGDGDSHIDGDSEDDGDSVDLNN